MTLISGEIRKIFYLYTIGCEIHRYLLKLYMCKWLSTDTKQFISYLSTVVQ